LLDRSQQERQFRGDDREKILSARQAAEALFYAETKSHGVCFGSFVVRRGAQTTRVADLVAGADSSANGRGTARAAAGDRRGTAALPRPAPSVYAFFFNPSVSYVISEQWNASFSMPTTRRWFDTINGVTQRNLTWEPTGVVEYVIPAGRGGRSANAGQSRHRLCRWGREKLVEPINSRLYPMASRSRLQDGVAILDQRVGLWIAKAGAYFGDRCVSC
jgi:hypothetical protein